MRGNVRWLGLVGAALLWACGGDEPPPSTGEKILLRVPMYPYIPDSAEDQFQALTARLEADFEAIHPDIDLVINPSCSKDTDFYEPEGIARSLKGEGDCPFDVIETDTAILGELVATGALRPWPRMPDGINFHPSGLMASTLSSPAALYGVPHWLCNHFIMSRSESVRQAQTATALVQALAALGTPEPDTAVDMLGSWNLPSLYLDGWADRFGGESLRTAVTTASYDPGVVDSMHRFVRTCAADGKNPCIDGTYSLDENFDLPAQLFAQGKVDSTLGYSERLHTIIKSLPAGASASDIKLSSAPLGDGNTPILFTDSYLLSARCTGDCEKAALAFTAYMSQPSTFEWILMSEDAPEAGRVPRYLLPAVLDVHDAPKIRADPFYPVLDTLTRNGVPFPNGGLRNIRKQMEADLKAMLSSP
jgi:thiamine pyridinylase